VSDISNLGFQLSITWSKGNNEVTINYRWSAVLWLESEYIRLQIWGVL